MPTVKVIIDTDPGVDDAIAIMVALADPEVELLGLTTVGGNVSLSWATRNALALLEYAERSDVPVSRGASRPRRGSFPYAHHFHGKTGLTLRLPKPRTKPIGAGAVDLLAQQIDRYPGEIRLVALGPLTNLARLERRHPQSLRRLKSLVVMGGAVGAPGNVTPDAEFNFYSDPVGAHEVLSSGAVLTLVDLAACRQVSIGREPTAAAIGEGRLGTLVVQLLQSWFEADPKRERFEFYDPLTWAAAIEPGILKTRSVAMAVETEDTSRLGESRVLRNGGPVQVVEQVDRSRFFAMLSTLVDFPEPV